MEESRDRAIRVRRATRQRRELLNELESKRKERKAVESYLTALLLERGWSRKETSRIPVCLGLDISLTVTPDLSPGERKAERVLRARGEIISWSVTAEVKPAHVVCSAPTYEAVAVCSVPGEKVERAGEEGGEGVATPNKIKTQNHPFSGGPAKHCEDEAMSAKSKEERGRI